VEDNFKLGLWTMLTANDKKYEAYFSYSIRRIITNIDLYDKIRTIVAFFTIDYKWYFKNPESD